MKKILLMLLLGTLITSVPSFAQIELGQDTTSRPSKTNTVRPVIRNNNLLLVPRTGSIFQVTSSLRLFNEFTTYTNSSAIYDGSVWVKTSGVTSNTTIGYGAVLTESVGGFYYRRLYSGAANALWFGIRGDANDASASANTIAFQKAVDYVVRANNPGGEGSSPTSKLRVNSLYIPSGTYHINTTSIKITGAIKIFGDGGLSYGGTFIYQRASNQDLFTVDGSLDGGNCALQLEDIRLRGLGSSSPSASLVHVPSTVNSVNSVYLNRVWFQSWERFAINIEKGDDFQATNCTFDGGFNYCFAFGSSTTPTSNVVMSGNTFYGIRGGLGYLGNIDGFQFNNNRVFGASGLHGAGIYTGFGIDASNGVSVKKLQVTNNTFDEVDRILIVSKDNFNFSDNVIINARNSIVEFRNSSFVRYATITSNTITGTWTQTATVGGATVPISPFYAPETGVRNSVITGNIIAETGGSNTAFYMPNNQNSNNTIQNNIDGFITKYNVFGYTDAGVNFDFFVKGADNSKSSNLTGNIQTVDVKSGFYSLFSGSYTGTPDDTRQWELLVQHVYANGVRRVLTITDRNDPVVKWTGSITTDNGLTFTGWSSFVFNLISNTSTQSGTGVLTSFTIPHGLGTSPTYVNVQAGSTDAKNIAYVTKDATNITVVYTTAPPTGTNNLTFYWSAKK